MTAKKLQGKKTHEEQLRILGRKPDLPEQSEMDAHPFDPATNARVKTAKANVRESEFAVSRGGLHQESRGQNKHNRPGQKHHKPQKHGEAEEKR